MVEFWIYFEIKKIGSFWLDIKCKRKTAIKKESTKFFGPSIKRWELPLTDMEKAWKSKASTPNRSEKGLTRREKE